MGRSKLLDDLKEFFRACNASDGSQREPTWEEHLEVINESCNMVEPNSL